VYVRIRIIYKRIIPPTKTSIIDPIYIKTSADDGKHAVDVRHTYPIIGKDIPVPKIKQTNTSPQGV